MTEVAHRQIFMERDMRMQAEWLARRAKAQGFADLDDLLGRAPAAFTRLATMWRQTQALSGTP